MGERRRKEGQTNKHPAYEELASSHEVCQLNQPVHFCCPPEVRVHVVLELIQCSLLLTGHPLRSHDVMLNRNSENTLSETSGQRTKITLRRLSSSHGLIHTQKDYCTEGVSILVILHNLKAFIH